MAVKNYLIIIILKNIIKNVNINKFFVKIIIKDAKQFYLEN